jgi:hypothetical protein
VTKVAVLYTLDPNPKEKAMVCLMATEAFTLTWKHFSPKKFSGINTKTHNQAQHYTAFGCRTLASSRRCARRYTEEEAK